MSDDLSNNKRGVGGANLIKLRTFCNFCDKEGNEVERASTRHQGLVSAIYLSLPKGIHCVCVCCFKPD